MRAKQEPRDRAPRREKGQNGCQVGQGTGEKVGEEGREEWAELAEAGRGAQGHPTRPHRI